MRKADILGNRQRMSETKVSLALLSYAELFRKEELVAHGKIARKYLTFDMSEKITILAKSHKWQLCLAAQNPAEMTQTND